MHATQTLHTASKQPSGVTHCPHALEPTIERADLAELDEQDEALKELERFGELCREQERVRRINVARRRASIPDLL